PLVRVLSENGIPVLGHIGLTPQSILMMGGYKVQGKKPEEAESLIRDARALEGAGAFAIVLECVPPALGADITASVGVPVVGIGAGPDCDGQILVSHDLLGLSPTPSPKFVKLYAAQGDDMIRAFEAYAKEVQEGTFPGPDNCY
ncbi:MAG: 3-methyl-2-oxobutanoate hydroxymethyltransferase, partial [Lentisphaerae bacterium]|nr:3-methyl-2-oxobutanoate hydroxymethyltransferase [Lentisphaerota bacterium]